MSTRKKHAEPPRQAKAQPAAPPPPPLVDIDALLMIGEERVHIAGRDDDNITFMAEPIE